MVHVTRGVQEETSIQPEQRKRRTSVHLAREGMTVDVHQRRRHMLPCLHGNGLWCMYYYVYTVYIDSTRSILSAGSR